MNLTITPASCTEPLPPAVSVSDFHALKEKYSSLRKKATKAYCALDGVLSLFQAIALEKGIDFNPVVFYPMSSFVRERDICRITELLLESAFSAGEKRVDFTINLFNAGVISLSLKTRQPCRPLPQYTEELQTLLAAYDGIRDTRRIGGRELTAFILRHRHGQTEESFGSDLLYVRF
ncbi:hypothetical protein [Eubacterium sp. 1001713B170207_170306_E7]|uniref:hypothetical protein n=1 Tax=Eubacterium sp. 1001713B170207_170306_E7 TaxID=2787097 RepID=UPI001896C302|nr:hypothetical protein [Eubacterium sp. 1001713B170207_170306_E7]